MDSIFAQANVNKKAKFGLLAKVTTEHSELVKYIIHWSSKD